MSIEEIRIGGFRNIERASLLPASRYNVLYGPNGSGKTSVLEAVFVLGRLRSFRTHLIDESINKHQPAFQLFAGYQHGERRAKAGVERQDKGWRVRVDGETQNDPRSVMDIAAVEAILPNAQELLLGPPRGRRQPSHHGRRTTGWIASVQRWRQWSSPPPV